MLVILPGHVRGMIVRGGDDACCKPAVSAPADASCCPASLSEDGTPSPERQAKCAVCYQALGYAVPAVYDFDLAPTGRCELRRLIEATTLHQRLCRPTYFANGPPQTA